MNIIENNFNIEESDVLDLFSGTGNIAFEFASRGAKSIRAVEQNLPCFKFIAKTKVALDFGNLKANRANVFQFLPKIKEKYDLIFADPFYDMDDVGKIPRMIFDYQLLKEDGWLILEHSKNHDFSDFPNFDSVRKYGNANFTIFIN